MEELKDNQMKIVDEDGKEVVCDVMFTYESKERGCKYVVFTVPDDEEGIYAMRYAENGDLEYIEDEKEWDEIQEVVDAFQEEHPEKL